MTKTPTKKTPTKAPAKKKTTPVSTDVLINLVVDASGSMGGLREATMEGINGFLNEQRGLPGKARLSLTFFDTGFDVRFVAQDLVEVPNLGEPGNPYNIGGGTALYDAVATTIEGTEAWLRKHPAFHRNGGRVVCVINTDGEENSSVTYSRHSGGLDRLNDLITQKQTKGWEFVFMGAGQAAWTEGEKFTSIPASNFNYYNANNADTLASYAGASTGLTATRTTGVAYTGKS